MPEQATDKVGMDQASLRARASEACVQICGWRPDVASPMPAHASPRRYVRCRNDGTRRVVMLLPDEGAGASEAGAATVGRVADEPFLTVGRELRARGVRVPECFGHSEELRAIVLEDLGDRDFDQWATSSERTPAEAYGVGLNVLLDFTRRVNDGGPSPVFAQRCFTADLLRWELDHYIEWRVEADLGQVVDPGWRRAVEQAFDALVGELLALPQVVVHRDFQSHNLMVPDRMGADVEVVVLDYQDMLVGPLPYDAVAFLRDSYVTLPDVLFEELVERWARGIVTAGLSGDLDERSIVHAFHLQTVQRKLKDAGRFVFIDRVRGNPDFLRWIPSSLSAVQGALQRAGDPFGLLDLLSSVDPLLSSEVR